MAAEESARDVAAALLIAETSRSPSAISTALTVMSG